MDERAAITAVECALRNINSKLFDKFFVLLLEPSNVEAELLEQARNIYKEKFSSIREDTFDDFLKQWCNFRLQTTSSEFLDVPDLSQSLDVPNLSQSLEEPTSRICNTIAFDPGSKRYVKTTVVPPIKKRCKEEFNPHKFIMQKQKNGEAISLRIDTEIEDYLNNCDFEEKNKKYLLADQALRKIARAITVLNPTHSYRLMDIHSEKIVR